MSNFKTIHEYFKQNKTFWVPYYQRGYKWSVQINKKKKQTHLQVLLDDLKEEFNKALYNGVLNQKHEYFLQGVTVKEKNNHIELVDGQQRTTTLFIILAVLQKNELVSDIDLSDKLHYEIRKSANETLQNFLNCKVEGDENVQDIAALKRAYHEIDIWFKGIQNKKTFSQFILRNVKLIYVHLSPEQNEANVFSMMNQDKAEMTQTDLIKSNALRESSRQLYEGIADESYLGKEWQVNQLRSKMATEWDNWRKWYENEDHIKFMKFLGADEFKNEPLLSVLLRIYWMRLGANNEQEEKISQFELFEKYKSIIADKEKNIIEAIEVFQGLRLLQKIFEEWFNNVKIYNYLGLLFKGSGLESKMKSKVVGELIDKYIDSKDEFHLIIKERYIAELFHDHENGNDSALNDVIYDHLNLLVQEETDAYHNHYTEVSRHLLRMNVCMALKHNQKFNFDLYEELKNIEDIENANRRSLEHIKPQNPEKPIYNTQKENELLNSLTNTIGNIVLIPKGLNSKLKNYDFYEKKKKLFKAMLSENKDYGLWLHTIDVFGRYADWKIDEINNNKVFFISEASQFFEINK